MLKLYLVFFLVSVGVLEGFRNDVIVYNRPSRPDFFVSFIHFAGALLFLSNYFSLRPSRNLVINGLLRPCSIIRLWPVLFRIRIRFRFVQLIQITVDLGESASREFLASITKKLSSFYFYKWLFDTKINRHMKNRTERPVVLLR